MSATNSSSDDQATGHRSQKPIELILLRQLVAHLALPVLLVDTEGTLIFRNLPAEELFGVEPGELPDEVSFRDLAQEFLVADADGHPVSPDQIPILWSLEHHLPRRTTLLAHDRAGTPHHITTTAFPLEGQGGAPLGAMSIFWETDAPSPGLEGPSEVPVAGATPIEMVLLKQVASYLAMPMFVADAGGDLVYYNEPAEALLGRRYEETGHMPVAVWGTIFTATDSSGDPLPPDQLPLALAISQRRATQGSFWIRGLDGVTRRLVITAIPLNGFDDRALGAFAIFWEG